MKKIFYIILFSLFSLNIVANDIRDFQIEEMSIGDNLTNYFSINKIQKHYKKNYYKYKKNKKFIAVEIFEPDLFSFYEGIQIHISNFGNNYTDQINTDYIISHIVGFKVLNYDECKQEQKKVEEIFIDTFKNADLSRDIDVPHDADPSGNSIATASWFDLKSGDVALINCVKWSEEMQRQDHLRVGMMTKEFDNWLIYSD